MQILVYPKLPIESKYIEIILIAGILYGNWLYIKKRRREAEATAGLPYIRQMDSAFDKQRFKDQSMDAVFKVQGTWVNRNPVFATC
ncbi:MAG: hypothetical protein FD159_2490 [Syntrophaceae bacterium]|nr:MAG: hypothetical protein FD159_2490 [Syntrophaceae bacterium]